MKADTMSVTPPDTALTPLVLHIGKVYKILYALGNKLSKRDKLGIHKTLEELTLQILKLSIKATFSEKERKVVFLEELRATIESAKIIVRTEYEIGAISQKIYFVISAYFIETSKMTNGWLRSLKNKTPR